MDVIWTVLIGFVAGVVAKLLAPGTGALGLARCVALGIAGALAGTYLGRAAGLYNASQSSNFIGAVIGAALLLLAHPLLTTR